jgi:hypothetical protein
MTIGQLYDSEIRPLAPNGRLRLAARIMNDLTTESQPIDESDSYSDEDLRDFARSGRRLVDQRLAVPEPGEVVTAHFVGATGVTPLRSLARRPEENVLVTHTSIRTHVGAVGIRVDSANRSFPAVRDGRLIDAGAGIPAPRCFGAGKDKGTGDLAFFNNAQARALQEGR